MSDRIIPAFTQLFDNAGDPLVNGWLKFLVSGTTSTLKDTYADVDMTIPNTNPVQLSASGRAGDIFGTGVYRVISYTQNVEDEEDVGEQIELFDPVP